MSAGCDPEVGDETDTNFCSATLDGPARRFGVTDAGLDLASEARVGHGLNRV